jgi:DDE superfamily endonuclease
LAHSGDLFANECQRRHCAEYLTGLIVAERKTVLGIPDEFARTTDQSCLNRYLTEAVGDAQALNQRRLERLQEDPFTRSSDPGVIPIDNTVIDWDGLLLPDAGWYWDHAEEPYKVAQDSLFLNDVGTSGQHDPREFRLFRKEEVCQALKEPFRNQTVLCCEWIDWACDRNLLGDFTRDCDFTSAEVLNHPPWENGSVRAAPRVRRRPQDQPQAPVEGTRDQGE